MSFFVLTFGLMVYSGDEENPADSSFTLYYIFTYKQIFNFYIDYYHTGIGQGIDCCS